MASNTRVNIIKQNSKMKQFIGWGIAIIFPLAAKGIMEFGRFSFLAVLVYWFFCGILMREIIGSRVPFLNINVAVVKKELFITLLFTAAGIVMYLIYFSGRNDNAVEMILGTLIFVIINGIIEPLVWANIFDLAGCRIKVSGYIAVAVSILMMYTLFWNGYCNFFPMNNPGIIILQIIIMGLPVLIYEKSGDITIWSLQHIVCSLIMLYASGFDILKLLNI